MKNKEFSDRHWEAWKKNPEDPVGQMLQDEDEAADVTTTRSCEEEMLDVLQGLQETHK